MLKTRVITALVLMVLLLAALFAPSPLPFAALSLLFFAAAGWEWARLNGMADAAALATGLFCGVVCAALWGSGAVALPLPALWLAAALAWVLGGGWLLARGVAGWPRIAAGVRWLIGVAALCVAWLALAQARWEGINFLLSVMALVWAADVCAYFAGRALGGKLTGGRKLAPTISPGKSWEGVWGGMAGVLALAALWVWFDARYTTDSLSLYTRLLHGGGWPLAALSVLFLAALSVAGDLLESLVKRSAGAKDSSRLLPGHGGVLDRVDALLPTLPLAMMLLFFAQVRG
jgi:phosphatidate cytidylyltransferase